MYIKTEARVLNSKYIDERKFNIIEYNNVIDIDPPHQTISVTKIQLWGGNIIGNLI